jgi:hypothetical protein
MRWSKRPGWINAHVSDKGRFTLDALAKFGGLSALSYFLLSERKRALLEKYRDHSPARADVRDDGLFLNSDRRRYLDFMAVRRIVGGDREAADLLDDLIGKSVLHRGLVLKCEFCRSTDWCAVAELSDTFRCKRCGRSQAYGQFHSLSRLEPSWYYKLDEIVFKALSNDFLVPVLTLRRLGDKAESFLHSPELELLDPTSGAQIMEVDLCCVIDGRIVIGEAKKSNRLAGSAREERETVNKYLDVAGKIGASLVVFATLAESWRDETARMIVERFSGSLTDVTLWSRADLLTPR